MGFCGVFGTVLLTIFFPPLGVLIVAGCSTDLCINFLLTLLGYIPGHIHAFYLEYVWSERRKAVDMGQPVAPEKGGVYSHKVLTGGRANAVVLPAGGVVPVGAV